MREDQAWYLFVGSVGLLYSVQTFDTPVLRRPRWLPPSALRGVRAAQAPARVALPLVCALAALNPDALPLRLGVLLVWAALDAHLWSSLGTHASFACLYACAALVVPAGRGRDGALLVAAVHQLASSGVQKVRVGGWRGWAHPETMAQTLRFALLDSFWKGARNVVEPGDCIKAKPLIRAVVGRPLLCGLAGHAALAVEVVLMPLALFAAPARGVALLLGCGLHAAIAAMHGYVFVFNPPLYMMAFGAFRSLSDAPDLPLWGSAPALVAAALAVASTALNLEDWPLNHMGLYSYNHEQVAHIVSLWDRFILQPSSAEARRRRNAVLEARQRGGVDDSALVCVAKYGVGLYPSTYRAEFARALGLRAPPGSRPPAGEVRERLRAWLRRDRPFVCARSFAVLDDVQLLEPGAAQPLPRWLHGDARSGSATREGS